MQMTLSELIEDRRKGRSLQRLADDAGGVFKYTVWQQWSNPSAGKEPTTFPTPKTIRAMAQALEVSETEIVLAAAKTLGLDVGRDGGERDLLVAGAGSLPELAKATLLTMARALASTAERDGV